jgi:hypothetical protein
MAAQMRGAVSAEITIGRHHRAGGRFGQGRGGAAVSIEASASSSAEASWLFQPVPTRPDTADVHGPLAVLLGQHESGEDRAQT